MSNVEMKDTSASSVVEAPVKKKRTKLVQVAVFRDGTEHVIQKMDGRFIYTEDITIKQTSKRLAKIISKRVQ